MGNFSVDTVIEVTQVQLLQAEIQPLPIFSLWKLAVNAKPWGTTLRALCGLGSSPWESQGLSHCLSQAGQLRVTRHLPSKRSRLDLGVSLWVRIEIWAQTQSQDDGTMSWGRVTQWPGRSMGLQARLAQGSHGQGRQVCGELETMGQGLMVLGTLNWVLGPVHVGVNPRGPDRDNWCWGFPLVAGNSYV